MLPAFPTLLHASTQSDLTGFFEQVGPVLFYLTVWGLVFAGTGLFVGVVIPFLTGDSLLFAAGIIAASHPSLNIGVLCAGVGVAAVAGDQLGFVLGRRLGRPYLTRRGGRWTRAAIAKTERFYSLFGWWSVVIGRYIPWGRVFVPPVAGIGGMAYWRFLTANIVGALSWGVLITVAGFLAAQLPGAKTATYVVAGCAILASVVAGVLAWRRDRRLRTAEASLPLPE